MRFPLITTPSIILITATVYPRGHLHLTVMIDCQLILTNKVCAAVLLLWVMEAMFNRIFFCCNGHQGTVL
jgi:hypothetical protein